MVLKPVFSTPKFIGEDKGMSYLEGTPIQEGVIVRKGNIPTS